MMSSYHAVGFLHLAAHELRLISNGAYDAIGYEGIFAKLRLIAEKLDEEAVALHVTLAPKEEKDAQDR